MDPAEDIPRTYNSLFESNTPNGVNYHRRHHNLCGWPRTNVGVERLTGRAKSADAIAKFRADQRPSDIAKPVGIGRASVYRILNDAGLVRSPAETSRRGYTVPPA
jgi:hypothetical protein